MRKIETIVTKLLDIKLITSLILIPSPADL